jgi:hypothetical protein
MIKLLFIFLIFTQIKNISPNNKLNIEIVTKKSETYNVLTKNEPITFTVEGSTYIRVYTRIPWPKGNKGTEIYKIIFQENELDERIITLESEASEVTKDKKGRTLSKWRSFYIEVPEGENKYKIIHWSSPRDTILVKFAYESPKEWTDIPATHYQTIMNAIEEEKIIKYYELRKDQAVRLEIIGPIKLQVISRLNYDEKLLGEQNYIILVDDNGNVNKFPLKCYKSEIITYEDRKEIVPSNARSFYINLKEGRHVLKFNLSGTLAQSVSLRFLGEKK